MKINKNYSELIIIFVALCCFLTVGSLEYKWQQEVVEYKSAQGFNNENN